MGKQCRSTRRRPLADPHRLCYGAFHRRSSSEPAGHPGYFAGVLFPSYKYSQQGAFWAFVVSCLIIVFVQYGVIPGLVWLSARLELLFVNAFGLPFDSGFIIFLFLLTGGLVLDRKSGV